MLYLSKMVDLPSKSKVPNVPIVSRTIVRKKVETDGNGFIFTERKFDNVINPLFAVKSTQLGHKEDDLPFPNTKYLNLLTFLPSFKGIRPDKISYGNPHFLRAISKSYSPALDDVVRRFGTKYAVLSGTWGYNQSSLEIFGSEPTIELSRKQMLKAYKRFSHFIPRPPDFLKPPSREDVAFVKTNVDAYPGYKTSLYFGRTRGEVASKTIPLAKTLFDRMKKPMEPNSHFWVVGGRAKRIKLHKIKEVSSRLFCMPEDVEHRVSSAWGEVITNFFSSFSPEESSVHIGQSYMNQSWLRMRMKFFNTDFESQGLDFFLWEGDYKNFDATIYPSLISFAFEILRSFFPPEDWIDNHFCNMAEIFINKNLICPDGSVYKVCKGIPSGSSFTNIIGTIVNVLVHMCALDYSLPPTDDHTVKLICGGDDSLIGFVNNGQSRNKYYNFIKNHTGLNISEFYEGLYSPIFGSRSDSSPIFFKRQFLTGKPVSWKEQDLYENLAFPQEKIGSLEDEISRVNGILSIAPFGTEDMIWVLDYLEFLMKEKIEQLRVSPNQLQSSYPFAYIKSKGLVLDLDKCKDRFTRAPPPFLERDDTPIEWWPNKIYRHYFEGETSGIEYEYAYFLYFGREAPNM